MGAGSKYSNNIKTQGGTGGAITSSDIANKTEEANEILNVMNEKGIKYNKDDIVFALKDEKNNITFLEKGNFKSGLEHIYNEHSADFKKTFDIKSKEQLASFLQETVSKGKLESSTIFGKGYKKIYYYKGRHYVLYAVGTNGYIVTAFPTKLKNK